MPRSCCNNNSATAATATLVNNYGYQDCICTIIWLLTFLLDRLLACVFCCYYCFATAIGANKQWQVCIQVKFQISYNRIINFPELAMLDRIWHIYIVHRKLYPTQNVMMSILTDFFFFSKITFTPLQSQEIETVWAAVYFLTSFNSYFSYFNLGIFPKQYRSYISNLIRANNGNDNQIIRIQFCNWKEENVCYKSKTVFFFEWKKRKKGKKTIK